MAMLGITPSGQLYELDSSTHEPTQAAKFPRLVDESGSDSIHTKILKAERDEKLRQNKIAQIKARARAKTTAQNMLAQKLNADVLQSQSSPAMSAEEQMIAEGVLQMKHDEMFHPDVADFNRVVAVNVSREFGTRDETLGWRGGLSSPADYDQLRPVDSPFFSNPLTSDGRIRPITDYEQFVDKPNEGGYGGSVPSGLTGPQSFGAHPLGSLLSDITGINIDVSSQVDQNLPQLETQAEKLITGAGSSSTPTTTAPKPPTTVTTTVPAGSVKVPGIGVIQTKYVIMGAVGVAAFGLLLIAIKRR